MPDLLLVLLLGGGKLGRCVASVGVMGHLLRGLGETCRLRLLGGEEMGGGSGLLHQEKVNVRDLCRRWGPDNYPPGTTQPCVP